jgi:hypothetical protein
VELTAGIHPISSIRLSLSTPSAHNSIAHVRDMESAGAASSLSSSPSSSSVSFYRLPRWRASAGGLKAGESHIFGYVVRGMAPASVALSSVSCSDSKSDHSASALPFYAGPWFSFFSRASHSATPSSFAVPSAPAGKSDKCVVRVEQLARPVSEGGRWFDSEFMYSTYELKITNIGPQPFTWSLIKVHLEAHEELYEVPILPSYSCMRMCLGI